MENDTSLKLFSLMEISIPIFIIFNRVIITR